MTLVGYRGAAPALTDAIGGQIDGVCDAAASVSQAINDKLVRGLVVGSTVRLATLPDLPTSAEAGLPDFEAQGWNGLFAPKGTPPAIIAKLNAAARTAVESDAVKKRFPDLSTVAPDANEHTPEVLGATRDARRREIPEAAGREEVRANRTRARALLPRELSIARCQYRVGRNRHRGDAGHDQQSPSARFDGTVSPSSSTDRPTPIGMRR